MQHAHIGAQGGLVAHGRRHTTQKGGHFRTGLNEAEDVVHEQQNILLVHIAEMLSHRQSREAHTHTRTRGLVHLAVAEGHLRLGEVLGIDHSGFLEFLVEVIPFTGALAHAGEH